MLASPRVDALARWIEAGRSSFLRRARDGRLVLVAGAAVFICSCSLLPWRVGWTLPHALAVGPGMLTGEPVLGDFLQDVVGFRRLAERRDPYPALGEAFVDAGVDWGVRHASTHPPTAFLFAAPFARLPLEAIARAWAVVGYALVFLAMRCYGAPWPAALGLSLASTAWPPFAASFQQLTFVWLAAVALAFRLRDRAPSWAGAAVGIAALTKLVPLVLLPYFALSRRRAALAGAAAALGAGALAVLALHPGAFARYLSVRGDVLETILSIDNSSPLRAALAAGTEGVVALVAFVAALLVRNRRALLDPAATPEHSFFLYSFLAVFALPISWGYSLAPLLPVLGYFLVRGRAAHVVMAGASTVLLAIRPPFESNRFWIDLVGIGALFLLDPPGAGARPEVGPHGAAGAGAPAPPFSSA